jgi:NADPH:quinone reductase-like Zn-dependent oxidoreductase
MAINSTKMKAVVFTSYGGPDVLKLKEVEKPIPKPNEVLVRVRAASLNAADWHIVRGKPFPVRFMVGSLSKPKKIIPGADMAGIVESVGSNVSKFKVGDEVFGDLSSSGWGAFAQYAIAKEQALAFKPENIGFEQAAASCLAAVTALQGLKKGNIHDGMNVLVNGASGGVGTFAVQIAKAFGAKVTAICSTEKVEMVRSIGADQVIDYKSEDFTKTKDRYDLIVAANGKTSVFDYKNLLKPNGTYVMIGGAGSQMTQAILLGPLLSIGSDKKLTNLMAKPNSSDLEVIADLLKTGKVVPVIDKVYKLEQAAEAMTYLEEGHARGKIILGID